MCIACYVRFHLITDSKKLFFHGIRLHFLWNLIQIVLSNVCQPASQTKTLPSKYILIKYFSSLTNTFITHEIDKVLVHTHTHTGLVSSLVIGVLLRPLPLARGELLLLAVSKHIHCGTRYYPSAITVDINIEISHVLYYIMDIIVFSISIHIKLNKIDDNSI